MCKHPIWCLYLTVAEMPNGTPIQFEIELTVVFASTLPNATLINDSESLRFRKPRKGLVNVLEAASNNQPGSSNTIIMMTLPAPMMS